MQPDPLSPDRSLVRYDGWRIALLTVAPSVVVSFGEVLRAKGHELAAVVIPAGPNGPRPKTPEAWTVMHRLLQDAPPGCDVLLASRRDRLTPLLRAVQPDLILTFFFPWRVPPEALELAPRGAINAHPSLLPRHRGPNPLGWTLRSDEPAVGLTFHRMEAQFDTGPILAQGSSPLTDEDTPVAIADKLMGLASNLLSETLSRVAWGDAGEPQPESEASQAGHFEPGYRELDWNLPARAVHVRVRACRMSSWQDGTHNEALATLEGQRVRLQATRLPTADEPRPPAAAPGSVLERQSDGARLVQCGDGPLWVLKAEPLMP